MILSFINFNLDKIKFLKETMLIRIKNLKLKTIIGIYDFEEKIQRELIFNIELEVKSNKALASDAISDTVDYDDIIKIVKTIGEKRFALIEKMAAEIVVEIMKNKKIARCKLEIDKTKLYDDVDTCSVVIEKKRK